MTTLENMQSKVEVWLNTSAGTSWYKALDLQGRPTTKTVRGGKTFTITTFERQINQSDAASAELDLFRNGTFVLQKASAETQPDEVASSNSLTDHEIAEMVRDAMHGTFDLAAAIKNLDSSLTVGRIYEVLVAEDAPSSLLKIVQAKREQLTPTRPVERVVVGTKPEE